MTLCSGSRRFPHEEIVYEGSACPTCEALEKVRELEDTNAELVARCAAAEGDL
jgi:hypothetical protein